MSALIDYAAVSAEQWAALSGCFWGPPDEERYSCDTADEAIERILDDMHPTPIEEIGIVEIVAMRPVQIGEGDLAYGLDTIIEHLDEEYGDPDGDPWDPTPRVRAAMDALRDAIREDYIPWSCEEVIRVRVDPVEWTRAHRADWMEVGE